MDYRIIRSSRKTVAIEITPQKEILVRCPNRMAKRDIQRFVESKQSWISRHLAKLDQQPDAIPLTAEEIESLSARARQMIPIRTAHFARQMGVSYGRITIRTQHTRWGSCSSAGNLNFNCLLMLAPEEVLDYVIVHELCHRKEMNHSPKFWSEVEKSLPDHFRCRQWLKEHGGSLMARLPQTRYAQK